MLYKLKVQVVSASARKILLLVIFLAPFSSPLAVYFLPLFIKECGIYKSYNIKKQAMIYENIQDFSKIIQEDRRILCLDIGLVGIGVALSDLRQVIASPHSVYKRRNMSQDMGHLAKLAADEEVTGIVVGFPLELDGTEGKNCAKVRHFAGKLYKKASLPILLQDERMSTAAATRALKESNMTRKKRESLDDKVAASYILQVVLDGL